MILDELTLHNYGVYLGRQSLVLTPPSKRRPVILIGGLNGGGKTTLLEALQVVLFGRRSAPARAYPGKYADFLADCVSRNASPSEGAALELTFRIRRDALDEKIHVHRSWNKTASGVPEVLEVRVNGEYDPLLTEQWAERVEEILPSEVAPLFFFDGERIEELADLERSAEVLKTAVQSLLGLDIVDQLGDDLKVLERRHRKQSLSKEARAHVSELEDAFEQRQRELATATLEVGQLQNTHDQAAEALAAADRRYKKMGGGLYERRIELELELKAARAQIEGLDARLRVIAAGPAPLALIRPLLERVRERAELERDHERATTLSSELEARDRELLERLRASGVSKSAMAKFVTVSAADRAERTPESLEGTRLAMAPAGREKLAALLDRGLDEVQAEVQTLLSTREELQVRLDEVDRELATVPNEAAVAKVTRALHDAQASLQSASMRLESGLAERHRITNEMERARTTFSRELEKQGLDQLGQEDGARIILHAGRVQETLRSFRERVVEKHVGKIEGLVLDSFKQLLRKNSLVDRLSIDPSSYTVTLFNKEKKAIPSKQLSAGERQLLAVSLLWGLARAASRPLPFVVDTPLGRLDSVHRANMVTRYFPTASHQTLVLSTDEEVDEEQRKRLSPYIGREYLLDYDDKTMRTTVREGYFADAS